MPTNNMNVGHQWTNVASSDDQFLLITYNSGVILQVATTVNDGAPPEQLQGHTLIYADAVTRDAIGAGYVWMRVTAGVKQIPIVVTK